MSYITTYGIVCSLLRLEFDSCSLVLTHISFSSSNHSSHSVMMIMITMVLTYLSIIIPLNGKNCPEKKIGGGSNNLKDLP